MFFFGFFISPAIKVTLFQASLLNMEPTSAEVKAPIIAKPVSVCHTGGFIFASVREECCIMCQALLQLECHTSGLKTKKPTMIKPNKESSFVPVKIFCIHFPLLMPRVLM